MKRCVIGLVAIMVMATGALVAQELAGGIEGTVMDTSKAVIPGASVTATHVATNTVYRATTTGVGRFTIPRVRLGRYTVVVEAPGFRRAVVTDVQVEVGGIADVNVTMEIGALAEELTVTAETTQEVINTVSAELAAVVSTQRVLELPLDGRNASHLILMQAGVYFERNPDGTGNKLIVHGQRHRALTITLDGIDTQDTYNRASSIMLDQPLIQLTAENVQEFRVVTGLGTAEFGRGGAHMMAVTKSGTNDIHGSAFWFHRNTILNANEFFNNSADPKVETPPLIRNQFGGSIGGPLLRDKTFFYFGIEGIRESKGIPVLKTVYTAEAKQGLFRYLDNIGTVGTTPEAVEANPGLVRTVNIFECSAAVVAALGRDCVDERFDNSFPSTVDPTIQSIMDLIPLPNNFDVGDGLNTGGFRFNAKSEVDQWTPSFRLDHRLSDTHSFYGSFNYLKRIITGDFVNNREPAFPAFGARGIRFTLSRMVSGTLVSTFRPTLVNEVRVGFTHGENSFLPPVYPQGFNFPFSMDFANISDPLTPPGWGQNGRRMTNFHLRDVVTWVKGKHQIRAGFEWRHKDVDIYSFFEVLPDLDFDDSDNEPDWSESDLERLARDPAGNLVGTGGDIETVDRNRGEQMMNEFMGAWGELEFTFNAAEISGPFVPGQPFSNRYYNRELDLFFNDTWQLRPNLTLNLGLRWEYASVPTERDGFALMPEGGFAGVFGVSGPEGLFNPGVLAGSPCTVPTIATPTSTDVTSFILSCATRNVPGGRSNGLPFWNDDFDNFAPIISLAWDPWGDGKTAIRAGFRISYFQDAFSMMRGNLDDNEGLSIDVDCEIDNDNCAGGAATPAFLRLGIPTNVPPPFVVPAVKTHLDSSTLDFRTYDTNLKTPYYEEWTLGISREFARNWALEVRYVANRGLQLRRVMDFNEPNIFAFDPNTGMGFLDSFLIAQANLFCNEAVGTSNNFRDLGNAADPACAAFPLAGPNALMDVLLQQARSQTSTSGGGYRDSSLVSRLEFNEAGSFVHRLNHVETALSPLPRVRGGSFLAAVLRGDLPVNFFQVNPFVASARAMVNNSFSTYHALEIEVRRRFARGFTFEANYNWGKALSDFDGDSNTLLNEDRVTLRDIRYEYGEFMPRHQFNANWIYEFPFGPGKRFAAEGGFWGKFLEGWQFGGIVGWRSGRPISIRSGRGSFTRRALSDSNSVDLATPMSKSELRALTGERTLATGPNASGVFWLDPGLAFTQFLLPQPGRTGTLPRTPIFGPRRFRADFNFSKRTNLTETTNLEFRWEIFNAFNNTNFNVPVTNDIFNRSFGQILSTITRQRRMQFALKINF